ncbi:MAG: PEP-CTERM sorting domain-containing protein [Verrucomicrobiota bacterium]
MLSSALAAALSITAATSRAAVVFSDAFNYPAGDLVANSGGVWTLDGVPAAGTNFAVKAAGWGTGNGVQSDPREGNIRAMHAVDLSAHTNSTVYFSTLIDALPVPTASPIFGDGDEGKRFVVMSLFGEAVPGSGTLTERLYFGRASGNDANWGIYGIASGGNKFSTVTSDAFNGPKLLVLRVDFSSTGVDPARLYVLDPNNLPATEPGTADASTTPMEMGSVTSIRFGSGWSASGAANPTSWGMFDNMGVFTQWNDLSAVNVPEPGSALLLGVSLAGVALRRRRD